MVNETKDGKSDEAPNVEGTSADEDLFIVMGKAKEKRVELVDRIGETRSRYKQFQGRT